MCETGYRIVQIQDELVPLAAGASTNFDLLAYWGIVVMVGLLAALVFLLFHIQRRQDREQLYEEERILRGLESLDSWKL